MILSSHSHMEKQCCSSSLILSSFFVGILRNEIAGCALEKQQLNIEQFSPDILKFGIKHLVNSLTLNCKKFPALFILIFHVALHEVIKKKPPIWYTIHLTQAGTSSTLVHHLCNQSQHATHSSTSPTQARHPLHHASANSTSFLKLYGK